MAGDGCVLILFRVCPQNIGGGHDLRPQPWLSPGLICRCLVAGVFLHGLAAKQLLDDLHSVYSPGI